MFFKPGFDIQELLSPYLHLDLTLFTEQDGDGLACKKKFTNNNQGVPVYVRNYLEQRARDVLDGQLKPLNWLEYVDVFTLYGNHIDQQTSAAVNPKPEKTEKEQLVLLLSEAAFHLCPKYDYARLDQYQPRELSSHAQVLFYLAKARRYNPLISVEERLPLFLLALSIAKYLNELHCSKHDDPHAYENRISTYELPINYCYQDLNRFDEAAALMRPQLKLSNPFQLTQAHVQLANIYLKKYKFNHELTALEEALSHGQAAIEISESIKATAPIIMYNARVCLMDVYHASSEEEHQNIACSIAEQILADLKANTNCGAKTNHQEAAEKVLFTQRSTLACA